MKKEIMNDATGITMKAAYVKPCMEVVEMEMESPVLNSSGGGETKALEWGNEDDWDQ